MNFQLEVEYRSKIYGLKIIRIILNKIKFDNKFMKILMDVVIIIGIIVVVGYGWIVKQLIKELIIFNLRFNFMSYVKFIVVVLVFFVKK